MENVSEKVQEIICDQLGETTVESEKTFDGMGVDSLDRIEMLMAFEEEFDIEITDEEAEEWETVEDVINYIKGK
jgi:acyl carrier protein